MPHNVTDLPRIATPFDSNGHTALWRWRNSMWWTGAEAAVYFGVSTATYYRYESGAYLSLCKANMVIAKLQKTGVRLRYKDLLTDFKLEYT